MAILADGARTLHSEGAVFFTWLDLYRKRGGEKGKDLELLDRDCSVRRHSSSAGGTCYRAAEEKLVIQVNVVSNESEIVSVVLRKGFGITGL